MKCREHPVLAVIADLNELNRILIASFKKKRIFVAAKALTSSKHLSKGSEAIFQDTPHFHVELGDL